MQRIKVRRRYPRDFTDEEYNLIKYLSSEAKHGVRPRTTEPGYSQCNFYCIKIDCQWRMLPVHFPA